MTFATFAAATFGLAEPDDQLLLVGGRHGNYGIGINGRGWSLLLTFTRLANGAPDDIAVRPFLLCGVNERERHADWDRDFEAQPLIDAASDLFLRHVQPAGGVQ